MTDLPISEICAPISARKMPARCMWTFGGRRITQDQAITAQRQIVNMEHKAEMKRKRKSAVRHP